MQCYMHAILLDATCNSSCGSIMPVVAVGALFLLLSGYQAPHINTAWLQQDTITQSNSSYFSRSLTYMTTSMHQVYLVCDAQSSTHDSHSHPGQPATTYNAYRMVKWKVIIMETTIIGLLTLAKLGTQCLKQLQLHFPWQTQKLIAICHKTFNCLQPST